MNKRYLTLLSALIIFQSFAQTAKNQKPKLVVGIVVDQMRYDFLFRYWDKYGDNGFKRLVEGGYLCKDAQYTHVPTYTGPGHATIFTGVGPAINGIAGNEWFRTDKNDTMYCVQDDAENTVGSKSGGKMSPRNLLVTTITDQLRLSNNMQSKAIGISLKDRGAILPAGHLANAAYWYDGHSGNWISSTYYMKDLPDWLKQLNAKRQPDEFIKQPWKTLLPIEQYTESTADDVPYERISKNESRPVFPHSLPDAQNKGYEALRSTPYGNTLLKNLAIEAVNNEAMGKGSFTDFLTVSFSSTDYVGHQYGPNSIEVEDTYIRLDRDLAELFDFLEKSIGKDNLLVFLTADHGVAANPEYEKDLHLPAGRYSEKDMVSALNHYLDNLAIDENYKSGHKQLQWVKSFTNQQIYLDNQLITKNNLRFLDVEDNAADFLINYEGVAEVATANTLLNGACTTEIRQKMLNGYNPERSGDLMISFKPGWLEKNEISTSHGSGYTYDTHVPLLWYGWKIEHGSTTSPIKIVDVAATLSTLLNIEFPSGCEGQPIVLPLK